jgi:CHASE2 domain-containing sensor protein/signal transduction histidine kinase
MLLAQSNWRRLRQGVWIGLIAALVVGIIHETGVFTQLRLQATNVYFIRVPVSDQIVIVALDDDSLQRFGRSPAEWPRSLYVDLLEDLGQAGARVIALDILFSEATDLDIELAAAIETVRQSSARPRVIMAAVGVPPTGQATLSAYPAALRFENQLDPVASLRSTADYLGFVNTFPDADGMVRRQPSIIEIDGQPALPFSLASYLAFLRIPAPAWPQIVTSHDGYLQLTPQRSIPVDVLGFWQHNYFGPPHSRQHQVFPIISLLEILDGQADLRQFTDKIVLVGLANSTGITDQYPVPSAIQGELMSGVEIQAHAIETLLQNRVLQTLSTHTQTLLIGLLAVVAGTIYGFLGWYLKFVVCASLLFAGSAVAFILFAQHNILISLFDGGIALTLPVIFSLGRDITYEINRRRLSEFLLESVSQTTQQQLAAHKILPLIAADVQRILPESSVYIWLRPFNADNLQFAYQSHEHPARHLRPLAAQAYQDRQPVITEEAIILPLVWQKNALGVLAIRPPESYHLSRRQIALLQTLFEQLAPNLYNALMFSEIERQRIILETVVGSSPNSVLVLDEQYQVRRISQTFVNTFELQAENCLDRPALALFDAIDMKQSDQKLLEKSLQAGEPLTHEITLHNQTFLLNVVPLREIQWWVITLTDVSYLIRLNQLKTNMVRMLSHDLGNPLARILGYGSLLIIGPEELSETNQQFVQYIMDDAEEMSRIIEDVMQIEQLRVQETAFEAIDFRSVVTDAVKRIMPEIEDRQQLLMLDMNEMTQVSVTGNYRQLLQMVTNLLGNATKYTPAQGRITVSLYMQR